MASTPVLSPEFTTAPHLLPEHVWEQVRRSMGMQVPLLLVFTFDVGKDAAVTAESCADMIRTKLTPRRIEVCCQHFENDGKKCHALFCVCYL